jgi:hypothetical protein
MKTTFRNPFRFFSIAALAILLSMWSSCEFKEQDKFGKDYNNIRKTLGLPIIPPDWHLGSYFKCPAPKDRTIWSADPKYDPDHKPYYYKKSVYYNGDTLKAECNTYLYEGYRKWYKNGREVTDEPVTDNDTIRKRFGLYLRLDIFYIFKPARTCERDFTGFERGFYCEICCDTNCMAHPITLQQADEILEGWNLKRMNY